MCYNVFGDIMGKNIKKIANNKKGTTKKTVKTDVTRSTSSYDLKQLFIIIVVIVAVLAVVYILSSVFKKKDYSSIFDNNLDVTEIQYDEVLVGTMLDQSEDEYYVLVYDDEDPYAEIFNNHIKSYLEAEYKTRIYTVDLNNIFNRNSKADDYDYDDLKFKSTSLLKIEDGEIESHYEDSIEIEEILVDLLKEVDTSASA